MIYTAMPEILEGWGIDPSKLDDEYQIFVKQLRKPIGKEELQNIRIATLINVADVKFISFASDPH